MMNNNGKKKFRWQEPLISLVVTLVMLCAVLGAQYWYTSMTHMELDAKAVWIGNLAGGIIMFFIVLHFIKKPKDES